MNTIMREMFQRVAREFAARHPGDWCWHGNRWYRRALSTHNPGLWVWDAYQARIYLLEAIQAEVAGDLIPDTGAWMPVHSALQGRWGLNQFTGVLGPFYANVAGLPAPAPTPRDPDPAPELPAPSVES